jgi:hypothetical protein
MSNARRPAPPTQPTMEDVLRRMLATKPDPHVKKKPAKRKKK